MSHQQTHTQAAMPMAINKQAASCDGMLAGTLDGMLNLMLDGMPDHMLD